MGRLVDWKSVDILLHAFKAASLRASIRLVIIGDGVDNRLEGGQGLLERWCLWLPCVGFFSHGN